MNKTAYIAILTVAIALTIAAFILLPTGQKPDRRVTTPQAPSITEDRGDMKRIERLVSDLQGQANNTARLLSRLDARLNRIEASNRKALGDISEELERLSERQTHLEFDRPMQDVEPDRESVMESMRATYKEMTGQAPPASTENNNFINRFYEHGEIDEATRQQEALIAQTLTSGVEATEVLGIECRNAVCKVDYRPEFSDETGSQLSELEIINALTIGMGTSVGIANVNYQDGTSAIFMEKSKAADQ